MAWWVHVCQVPEGGLIENADLGVQQKICLSTKDEPNNTRKRSSAMVYLKRIMLFDIYVIHLIICSNNIGGIGNQGTYILVSLWMKSFAVLKDIRVAGFLLDKITFQTIKLGSSIYFNSFDSCISNEPPISIL